MSTLILLLCVAFAGDWEQIDDSDGVVTWRKRDDGSPLFAFRGLGEVDVHISRLVGLMQTTSKGPEWVHLLHQSERVKELGPGKALIYNHYKLAWPIQDRDYLLRRETYYEPERRTVTMTYESAEDAVRPEQSCCVRAIAKGTHWRFEALDNDRTRIDVEVATDPKGSIPAWAVNWIQKSWPHDSILALAKRAQESDVSPRSDLVGW